MELFTRVHAFECKQQHALSTRTFVIARSGS